MAGSNGIEKQQEEIKDWLMALNPQNEQKRDRQQRIDEVVARMRENVLPVRIKEEICERRVLKLFKAIADPQIKPNSPVEIDAIPDERRPREHGWTGQ